MAKKQFTGAHASLTLRGEDLDPLAITRALLIPPDHQHRAGEPRLRRSRAGAIAVLPPYPDGMWAFSSREWVQGQKLSAHVVWILEQVEPKKSALLELLSENVRGRIFCFCQGTTRTPPSLPQELRRRATALGLTIDVDFYTVAK